jgi:hypothetical protein
MSDPERKKIETKDDNEPWISFCDVPTSDEHSGYVSLFDTVLWIEQHVGTAEGDSWDASERLIRTKCETGELAAWGYKSMGGTFERNLSQIPPASWPNLVLDLPDGQPAHDREKHGDRWYGRALTVEPEQGQPANFRKVSKAKPEQRRTGEFEGVRPEFDGLRPQTAWTALCFLKPDVLKHWPEKGRSDKSGGQSFKAEDDLLVEEMRKLILGGVAKGAQAAARILAPKARMLGNEDSVVERLRRAYGRRYPMRKQTP